VPTTRVRRLTHPTHSHLVNTGSIRLLRNAGLRDRIIGRYEANERWATIIDRNNQAFVDQMYMQYMMDTGLIAPRATGKVWQRSLVGFQASIQARDVSKEVTAVRQAVAAEIARRWPEAQQTTAPASAR